MKPLREANGHEIIWVHTDPLKWEHELRSGTDTFARLCYASAFSTRASAETADERWTLARTGVLRPQATARVAASGSIVATVVLGFLGRGGRAEVTLSDGQTFAFGPVDVLGLGYAMTGADGGIVYRSKRPAVQPTWSREGKLETQLEITPAALATPALALLVLLGRYLLVP